MLFSHFFLLHFYFIFRDISDLITFYEDWDEEILLTGNVWFGHVPPDNEKLHKKRFWLWRRMVEHEFPQTWPAQIEIDRTRVSGGEGVFCYLLYSEVA